MKISNFDHKNENESNFDIKNKIINNILALETK